MYIGNWFHQDQECEGTYTFDGQFLITRGVKELLSDEEIKALYLHIQQQVKDKKGLDYLQVFKHKSSEQKLYFIDQLSKEMKESGHYSKEDNVCTLMRAEEY